MLLQDSMYPKMTDNQWDLVNVARCAFGMTRGKVDRLEETGGGSIVILHQFRSASMEIL